MSAASLLPRQCLARAPANLHDRKGPALISHGHLPALSSFYSACVCHCRARVRILLIPTRDKPTPAPAYTAHTHKTDTWGDGAHPQAPRGGDPAATGRGIPTPAPVWRYRRAARDDAAILEDLSSLILGLERCDGLREIVQQIESGAVKKIRDRYGPAAPGCRGTADPMWSKYSNLVSKRERLGRILEIDFVGDKDRFFAFFTVSPPNRRKKQKIAEEPSNSTATEHFRAFRRIVEAHPWCEADLAAERRKAEYLQQGGEFSQEIWDAKWGQQNIWEVWRVLGGERYTKVKDGDSNKQQVD
ncbi:hypothetical protein C8J57DRAFT_1608144 [Mycena rebaudengoi]|nr:hypothetical protein C8J57DRAFT_1608144 [Mycena rebaudengoi]